MKFQCGEISMDVNIEATKAYHDNNVASITCDCSHCRNYIMGISKASPDSLNLLASLGVNPVTVFGVETYSGVETDGSFHKFIEYDCYSLVVGTLNPGPHMGLLYCGKLKEVWFAIGEGHSIYMDMQKTLPDSCLQLIFRIKIPWVLDYEHDELKL